MAGSAIGTSIAKWAMALVHLVMVARNAPRHGVPLSPYWQGIRRIGQISRRRAIWPRQVAQALCNTATGLGGGGATFDDVVRLTFHVTAWAPEKTTAFMEGIESVAAEI